VGEWSIRFAVLVFSLEQYSLRLSGLHAASRTCHYCGSGTFCGNCVSSSLERRDGGNSSREQTRGLCGERAEDGSHCSGKSVQAGQRGIGLVRMLLLLLFTPSFLGAGGVRMLPDRKATAYYLFSIEYFRTTDKTTYPSRCVATLDAISWATDPQDRATQTPPRLLIPAGGKASEEIW
jgi:hypothetical protein